VLDDRLGATAFLAGPDYTIADIACWPWTRFPDRQGVDRDDYPNFVRWFDEIAARPAVQKGIGVLADLPPRDFASDAKAREFMFGSQQYQRRQPRPGN
jgi:GST-like protein